MKTPLTITIATGEDEGGEASEISYSVLGMPISTTQAQSTGVLGYTPAGELVAFITPVGYNVSWFIEPGAIVDDGMIEMKVTQIVPVTNPRTGVLKLVQVIGGI